MITRENARVHTLLKEHSLKLPDFVEEYVISKSRAGLSPRTLLQYVYKYTNFFSWALSEGVIKAPSIKEIPYTALEHLKKEDIELYLDHLRSEDISNSVENAKFRGAADIESSVNALRALFNYLTVETENEDGECYFYRNVMNKIVRHKKRETASKRARKINAKILDSNDITGLLEYLSHEYEHTLPPTAKSRFLRDKERDIAIISLILGSGLRVNEVVSLEMINLHLNKNIVDVIRKGGKDDSVLIMEQAKMDLKAYLNVRELKYKGAKNCPFVFTTIYKGSVKELTRRAVQLLVVKYTASYNEDSGISPQKLRHSFATDYMKNEGSIVTLRDQLGHSDIKTTSLYTNMSDDDNIKVLSKMNENRQNQ